MELDSLLTIELPGERVRSTIRQIINPDKVVVELTNLPMSKSHDYRQGNFVECIQKQGLLGNAWIGTNKVVLVYEEPEKEVKDVRVRRSKSHK